MPVKHLIVKGRVQGVGFRYSMFYAAKNFNVNGWVRNRRDGSVESMAEGDEKSLGAFIEWAKKGPELAQVDEVIVSEGVGHFDEFKIGDTIE